MSQLEIDWTGFHDDSMTEKFKEFHRANPHIARQITRRAYQLKQRGHRRCGMGMLFEVMRWSYMLKTDTDEPFKLNNNYRAYYSRLIEKENPDLEGFFTRRGSIADTVKLK
jgi:hypothetical protein